MISGIMAFEYLCFGGNCRCSAHIYTGRSLLCIKMGLCLIFQEESKRQLLRSNTDAFLFIITLSLIENEIHIKL